MTWEEQAAALGPTEIAAVLAENADLKRQVEWFRRQLFGRKAEHRLRAPDRQQLSLSGMLTTPVPAADRPPPPTETVKAYQRRARFASADALFSDSELRFDATVPVQAIVLANAEVADLPPEAYEVIGEKITYRFAQRPGAYVILKYIRPLINRKDTEGLTCPPAPPAVFEKSFADVSVSVGLLLDKVAYHLPLYRQHQRLIPAGIRLSRGTLTQWVQRAAELLEPIYYALLSSILQSQVLAMDETPIEAGRHSKGKRHTGYCWPVYGEQDEIAFPFAASRAGAVVREALGSFCGILVTDGYIVYERFAQTVNRLVHAQCWVHARRKFIEAERVLIDTFETPLPRPTGEARQRRVYSGKKKRHTLKTQVATDVRGDLLDIDAGHPGPTADKRIYEGSAVAEQFPRATKQGDLAYLGTAGVETPQRKPRGGQLTEPQRAENRQKASVRVHVEHGIRRLKAFRILREPYRHALGLFPMVVAAVAGLVHLGRLVG